MDEVKPCPFCGGRAEVDARSSRAWYLANVEKANDSNRRYAAAHGAENAMRCKRYRLRKEQERRMEALR